MHDLAIAFIEVSLAIVPALCSSNCAISSSFARATGAITSVGWSRGSGMGNESGAGKSADAEGTDELDAAAIGQRYIEHLVGEGDFAKAA